MLENMLPKLIEGNEELPIEDVALMKELREIWATNKKEGEECTKIKNEMDWSGDYTMNVSDKA